MYPTNLFSLLVFEVQYVSMSKGKMDIGGCGNDLTGYGAKAIVYLVLLCYF